MLVLYNQVEAKPRIILASSLILGLCNTLAYGLASGLQSFHLIVKMTDAYESSNNSHFPEHLSAYPPNCQTVPAVFLLSSAAPCPWVLRWLIAHILKGGTGEILQ